MLADYLALLGSSEFGRMARSSAWLLPIASMVHVLGSALLVGSITVYNVLLLGRRQDVAAAVAPVALPLALIGVLLLVPSGSVLVAAEAKTIGRNPAFLFKMTLISIGLFNIAAYYAGAWRQGREGGFARNARTHAAISLIVWLSVILLGRMIAYVR
jgi:hypothetical protein